MLERDGCVLLGLLPHLLIVKGSMYAQYSGCINICRTSLSTPFQSC